MKLSQHVGKIHSVGTGNLKLSVTNMGKTQNISNLSTVPKKEELPITTDQLNNIKMLKYKNGEPLVSDNTNPNHNDVFYEIINRIEKIGYNMLYVFLSSHVWKDEQDLYFSFPEFDSASYKYKKFIEEQFAVKEVVAGLYICKACKSDKTISFTAQLRSRDEGETVIIECTACGNTWKI